MCGRGKPWSTPPSTSCCCPSRWSWTCPVTSPRPRCARTTALVRFGLKTEQNVLTLEENAACQMGIDWRQRPIPSHHPNVQLPERLAPANPQDSNWSLLKDGWSERLFLEIFALLSRIFPICSDMNGQIAEKVDSTNETLEEFKENTLRRLESFGEGPSVSHFKYFHESKIRLLVF